jgi:hypothetical protein
MDYRFSYDIKPKEDWLIKEKTKVRWLILKGYERRK